MKFEKISDSELLKLRNVMKSTGKEYDFSVYNITKYFRLVMENNPNMIDSLFVPRNCVIHSTPISEKIRENRKMFLHRGAWHKFKGYAYSSIHKMNFKYKDVLEPIREWENKKGISKNSFHDVEKEMKRRGLI